MGHGPSLSCALATNKVLASAVSMEYGSVGGLDRGVEFRYGIPGNEESAQRALGQSGLIQQRREEGFPDGQRIHTKTLILSIKGRHRNTNAKASQCQ